MSATDDVVEALAREIGENPEDVQRALSGASSDQIDELASALDQPLRNRAALRATEVLSATPRDVGQSFADNAGSGARYIGGGLGAAGLGLGGAYAYGERQQRITQQEDAQTVRDIWNDPDASPDERINAIQQLIDSGVLGGGGGSGGAGGPLAGLLGDAAPGNTYFQWALILLALYFGGKALTAWAGSGGGSGGQ